MSSDAELNEYSGGLGGSEANVIIGKSVFDVNVVMASDSTVFILAI